MSAETNDDMKPTLDVDLEELSAAEQRQVEGGYGIYIRRRAAEW